ncbi:MAG: aminotransferase class I/II-fold pyridoxal phosphate-dependent enzyme [Luteitalea sp.]|nr:aminotransferase class I/II-fold pyridoxal phosphate-dependent enzyme [Luteitalea sp.]
MFALRASPHPSPSGPPRVASTTRQSAHTARRTSEHAAIPASSFSVPCWRSCSLDPDGHCRKTGVRKTPTSLECAPACGISKDPLSVKLAIPFSEHGGPLFRQVYLRVRAAILSGALQSGEKLPSTRQMAEQLGISRTVVLLAYDQLLAEGFAVGRIGSGTYVSAPVRVSRSARSEGAVAVRLSRFGSAAAAAWARVNVPERRSRSLLYDFAYGRSDLETFPFEMWRRILLRCARKARISELDYGPAAGNVALREAICVHLRRSRAVICDPAQVVVVNGSQQALDLVARVLIERGDRVAIEDPSYQGTREAVRAAGADVLPIAVDRDGLNPAQLPPSARMAFVTPSHQFPTGAILPLARRLALLEWAKRRQAVIVEDDYDGEFRYEGQPVEPLYGLDDGAHVVYIGTFSRTVFSALRIGYLVAPQSLVAALTSAKWLSDRHTTTLEQETLAEFMSCGMYERYLRRVRRRNAQRRRVLLENIHAYLGDRVQVTGEGAGAHVVLWPSRRVSEEAVIAGAAARGVGVYGISPYFLKRRVRTGIMLGYSRMKETEIREGIRRLADAL